LLNITFFTHSLFFFWCVSMQMSWANTLLSRIAKDMPHAAIGTSSIRRALLAVTAMARGQTAKELEVLLGTTAANALNLLKTPQPESSNSDSSMSLFVPVGHKSQLKPKFPVTSYEMDFADSKRAASAINGIVSAPH
jgi:hypothetical protein